MGSRGPAPKPTALKVLEGNPGKRALNVNEPRVDTRKPTCPKWMKGEARKEWERLAKELHAAGLLTYVDRAAMVAYCQAWGRYVDAEKVVGEKGMVLKTSNGNLIQNPYLNIANRAARDVLTLAREFGMTPSARSRIQTGGKDDDEPTLAETLFAMVGSSNDVE